MVSGPRRLVSSLCGRLEKRGVRTEVLVTSHAFHSALLDPVLGELEAAAAEFDWGSLSAPLVSNLTGRVAEPAEVGEGGYWRRQARSPVRFAAGVRTLSELGVGTVIEVGPRAVLGPLAALSWPESETGPAVVSSLGRERGFAEGVAAGYEAGVPVSFGGLFSGERRRRVSLPTYPFQRERHWVRVRRRRGGADAHPLLGERRVSASGEITFETELSAGDPAWLGDHRVFGRVVVPGAFYAAQAVAAVAGEDGTGSAVVEEVRIERPLVLADEAEDGAGRLVQFLLGREERSVGPELGGVQPRSADDPWVRHAAGRARGSADGSARAARAELTAAQLEQRRSSLESAPVDEFYRRMATAGIGYGPTFHGLAGLWSGEGEALSEVALPGGLAEVGESPHPALLDACFQTLAAAPGPVQGDGDFVLLPVGWDRLRWRGICRTG